MVGINSNAYLELYDQPPEYSPPPDYIPYWNIFISNQPLQTGEPSEAEASQSNNSDNELINSLNISLSQEIPNKIHFFQDSNVQLHSSEPDFGYNFAIRSSAENNFKLIGTVYKENRFVKLENLNNGNLILELIRIGPFQNGITKFTVNHSEHHLCKLYISTVDTDEQISSIKILNTIRLHQKKILVNISSGFLSFSYEPSHFTIATSHIKIARSPYNWWNDYQGISGSLFYYNQIQNGTSLNNLEKSIILSAVIGYMVLKFKPIPNVNNSSQNFPNPTLNLPIAYDLSQRPIRTHATVPSKTPSIPVYIKYVLVIMIGIILCRGMVWFVGWLHTKTR